MVRFGTVKIRSTRQDNLPRQYAKIAVLVVMHQNNAKIAQSVEHAHGKGEVPSSILGLGSINIDQLENYSFFRRIKIATRPKEGLCGDGVLLISTSVTRGCVVVEHIHSPRRVCYQYDSQSTYRT